MTGIRTPDFVGVGERQVANTHAQSSILCPGKIFAWTMGLDKSTLIPYKDGAAMQVGPWKWVTQLFLLSHAALSDYDSFIEWLIETLLIFYALY